MIKKLNKILFKEKIFFYISIISKKLKYKTYLIGGYVRNYFLYKKKSFDIDIVTTGNSIKLAKFFAKKILSKNIFFFKRFKTAIVKYKNYNIEFVSTRKEYYNIYNNKPKVKIYKSIIEDQNRRDFTINSIAVSLNINSYGKIIDTFNGLNDLKKKIIKTPINPNKTFYDDPLRMIRAIRFSSQLNFKLKKNLRKSIIENIDRIRIVSIERIIQEFNKILLSKKPSIGLKLMLNFGFLSIILPEFIPFKNKFKKFFYKNIFIHTLKVLDNINTNNLWLKWATLLQEIGKPICRKYIRKKGWKFKLYEIVSYNMVPKIFFRLKLPLNKNMKYVQNVIFYNRFFIKIFKKKNKKYIIKKIFLKLDFKIIKDILKLCYSNIIINNNKKNKKKFNKLLLIIKKIKKKNIDKIKLYVNGNNIMKILNINSCKRVGIIKNKIINLIIKKKINNKNINNTIININKKLNEKK
ncbi:MAG: tRNA nucleotidyltransferase [Candidatus Shikimatogenerans bostrichidophilus]|nr:MAG: tRNA nucleotidyltransferase [Candidatus Shikimatogenerans bostrichidophilus]